jgi:hypothetical protein
MVSCAKLCEMNQGSDAGEQTQIQWITNNLARRYTKHRPLRIKSGENDCDNAAANVRFAPKADKYAGDLSKSALRQS